MKIRLLILLIVVLIALAIVSFYFYPIPQVVQQAVENDIFHDVIQRCISTDGIGYDTLPVLDSDSSHIYYNSSGDAICTLGGEGSNVILDDPCKRKICFPVYGN